MCHGGAEKQVVVDANTLQKNGHKVTIAYHKNGSLLTLLNKDVDLYKVKTKNIFIASCILFRHLIKSKYDVILAHMFWAEKVASIPSKLTGHKLILVEHGLGLWRKWYHILIMKFIASLADKVLCTCESTLRIRIEKEGLNSKKLSILYNSFELTESTGIEMTQEIKQRDYFTIGYVGRFNKIKRIKTFIEIAKKLRKNIEKFKIILVGDGEEKKRIEEEISRNHFNEYFSLTGFVLSPSQYYQSFDIFILPSKREAFSVALLEASASGIPCLAFDTGGNAEIIQDAKTGFILPDYNINQMVNKILLLYENPAIRKQMGIEAKRFVTERFSVERRISLFEKLLNEA